jgi:hypothetical protein
MRDLDSSGFASTLYDVEAKRVEWPAGSGVYATYSPAERVLVRGLFRLRDEEKITDEQLHLKAILGARLVGGDALVEEEPVQVELALPAADSPFQIPPRALRRLVGAEHS